MKTFVLLMFGLLASASEKMNEKVPAGKAQTMVFTEDLRIGPEDEEDHHIWAGPNIFMEVDDADNMYVLDPYASKLLKFDESGKFLGSIGRRGTGPGEFQHLVSFKILPDGSFVLYDKPRSAMVFLDAEGMFKRKLQDVQSGRYVHSATFSPLGNKMAGFFITVDEGTGQMEIGTAIMGINRYPEKILFKANAPQVDPNAGSNPNWWARYLSQWFKLYGQGPAIATFGANGEIYTANTDKYEITRWSPELEKELTFGRKYDPIFMSDETRFKYMELMLEEVQSAFYGFQRNLITEKVIERAVDMADLPPAKPPIFGMVPMEDGKLLVVHDYLAKEGRPLADIFDEKGNFLGSAKLPKLTINIFAPYFSQPIKLIFKNGRAFAIELDEDYNLSLVRYTYEMK